MRSLVISLSNAKGHARLKLLFWAIFVAVLVGATGFAAPLDVAATAIRNSIVSRPASGDIVLVGIDDKSLARYGEWPWSRGHHAKMIDELDRLGAKNIFFDIIFSSYDGSLDDRSLAAALKRSSPRLAIAAEFNIDGATGVRLDGLPAQPFVDSANLININWMFDAFGFVWRLPYEQTVAGRPMPSMSAALANFRTTDQQTYPIDYSVDLSSIPYISAADLISGRIDRSQVAHKNIIVGALSRRIGDITPIVGRGPTAGAYIHILGAETLIRGQPVELGWFLPIVVTTLLCLPFLGSKRRILARGLFGMGVMLLTVGPFILEHYGVVGEYGPALTCWSIILCRSVWMKRLKIGETTNKLSGLPNLAALKMAAISPEHILIVARVTAYAKAASTVPSHLESEFVSQIVKRLSVGRLDGLLYHADHGVFAWVVPGAYLDGLSDHFEGIKALFNTPIDVNGSPIDVTIAFGADLGNEGDSGKRFSATLAAATDAAMLGQTWQGVDACGAMQRQWEVSMVGRLNQAIDDGHVWVAYQPKIDLRTGEICGAEALARWTDPVRGEIAPDEFVIAAEKQNNIEKLTKFVLFEAVSVAARMINRQPEFSIAVNLSPRVMERREIVSAVRQVLKRGNLAAHHLTLEITETAGIEKSVQASANLRALRKMGVRIAIDDYGTGHSTLDYMTRIEADEIKIDKSFVSAMISSQPNRTVVASTITLAHDLGRTIVAEGVEDAETLDLLGALGCDQAQGYYVGKPMLEENLIKRLISGTPRARVANS
jgi:diguanylate cyclase